MAVADELREQQIRIIERGNHDDYPIEKHLEDIDLIAELTVLKIISKKRNKGVVK